MTSTKSFMVATRATNYRFLTDTSIKGPHEEFDESDVWGGSTQSNSSESTEFRSHIPRKYSSTVAGRSPSVPVNVLDWLHILRDEYTDRWETADCGTDGGGFCCFDGGDEENDERVPPHEYLARTRNASFSVQEGIGRTLKGRDLSMIRNDIWEKTGFQD